MKRLPAPFQIVLLAALGCAAYYALCRGFGLSAPLAESNLQASLGRISRYLYEEPAGPSTVVAGSSIAGRLLPRYFAEAGWPVQNLGLDGSRPAFAFEVIARRLRRPGILLVETTHLFSPLLGNDQLLREQTFSPGFALSREVPLLRPQYRPSSLLYSWLKSRGDARDTGLQLSPNAAAPDRAIPPRYALVKQQLAGFQARGVKVGILEVPWQAGWGLPSRDPGVALARELDLPFLQPGAALAQRQVALKFSDGVHLIAPSARLVAREIVDELRGLEATWHFTEPGENKAGDHP